MKNKFMTLALLASLAACSGGNPFDVPPEVDNEDVVDGETVGDGEGTGIERDGIPPGTVGASPAAAIFRSEPRGEAGATNEGDGFAGGFQYNAEDDTFTVDNIAFDGDRPYTRGNAVSSLSRKANGEGRFAVFEAPSTATDPVNGRDVQQLGYRAIYGVSQNTITDADGNERPATQFAIVRTGDYINYGFGGFIYQRDTQVNLPNTLQATFSGHSAGLRDNGEGVGLAYTTADVTVEIDHDDFNDGPTILGDGIKGRITNRRIFDLNGNDITTQVASTLGDGVTRIPSVGFIIGPDKMDTNGEIVTEIFTQVATAEGSERYEDGTFYAIVSGDDPDEIVGVYVLEGTDGSRDTSGFIVYREDPE